MIAKLSVTTRCNARCKTCPVWSIPGADMTLDDFRIVWDRLMWHPAINKVLINSTGDMYNHPRRREIFEYIEPRLLKWVSMTTNAAKMDIVPRIPEILISFNGADQKGYEHTTGLPFYDTVSRIKAAYPKLAEIAQVELHALAWDGNCADADEFETNLMALWHDFPGKVRVSYKYDNQFGKDAGVVDDRGDRGYCDYLDMLVVGPQGQVARCSHDFHFAESWGNVVTDDLEDVFFHPGRMKAQHEHARGEFTGLCERCNYNVPTTGLVKYLKE